jgi:uncharacterized protein YjbI with pentapeptide repeats
MAWQKLADLPFASALAPQPGALAAGEAYDGAHFDGAQYEGATLEDADGSGSHFLECAFTGVSFQGGRLRQAQFADVWLHECRLLSTGLARTSWRDVTFTGVVMAGVEIFGSQLRRVRFERCKMDSVNFRDADLADVTFDGCVLRNVDFGEARLTRTAFPQSRLADTTLVKVTLDRVDLRGAELGLTVDPTALRGAIVTTAQLLQLAPILAEGIGIVVSDD